MLTNLIRHSRLLELLDYNSESGTFRWKTIRGGRSHPNRAPGSIDKHGYRIITVDGRHYYASRLAWFYVHGKWPANEIDHINRQPSDDRLGNLREATRKQNTSNTKLRRDNKSGFRGVIQQKDRWYATISDGTNKTKFLGSFKTPEEAARVYQEEAAKRHGEFFPSDQVERQPCS